MISYLNTLGINHVVKWHTDNKIVMHHKEFASAAEQICERLKKERKVRHPIPFLMD